MVCVIRGTIDAVEVTFERGAEPVACRLEVCWNRRSRWIVAIRLVRAAVGW